MKRTALRIGIALIFLLILSPAVSLARGLLVPGPERTFVPGDSRIQDAEGGITRLLALLRQVFGDWLDDGTCADSPCEKEEENRVGIDPNGNS